MLAVFAGGGRDRDLAALAERMVAQRAVTAGWIVDELRRLAPRGRGAAGTRR